jgi:hypothetical protein
MNQAQRRCMSCGLQVEVDAASCTDCGGEDLLIVRGQALAALIARHQYVQAVRNALDVASMVRCAFCHKQIEVTRASHSRYDGKPVCWRCKEREKEGD